MKELSFLISNKREYCIMNDKHNVIKKLEEFYGIEIDSTEYTINKDGMIEFLDLSGKGIKDLSIFSEPYEHHLSCLICLCLADNKIVDISPLCSLPSLSDVDLDNNKIVDISPLCNIKTLSSAFLKGVLNLSPLKDLDITIYY
jgi:hypothetical protein